MENLQNSTPCECPIAGYCERHGVEKSTHLHKLCKNHIGYFSMWEECRGPKQNPNDCTKQNKHPQKTIDEAIVNSANAQQKDPPSLPSTTEMAKNFLQSAASHLANGMKNASEEVIQQRLAICDECEFKVREQNRCGKCGCFLGKKTKWESSNCPIGKW
jgi:hypothetical protein